MAPEKIYLVPFGKPIREPLPQEGSDADTIWSSRPYANSNAGNIEHTRTDAFIERAADWIARNGSYYIGFEQGQPCIDKDFIDKFKAVMKSSK